MGMKKALMCAVVLVELYTSQGCSSCPDADRLLSTWGADQARAGRIVPLSFDVDYWDYLGWKDVFSAPEWSRRQARYARALGSRTYTPQMVVAGRETVVGSDEDALASAVARHAGEPARARIALSRRSVVIEPGAGAAGLHAMVAYFENGLSTKVERGENAGRELRSDFVVRKLQDLGPLQEGKRWKRALDPKALGVAVFLQDPETLAVYDAAASPPR